uniref:PGG domain-containing protein n=1 Tax=Cucumis sativus TaxID=3659 RepID=A0A0A0M0P8_CUCSA
MFLHTGWPKLEEFYAKKQKHNSAKALVLKLTNIDDSWFQATTNSDNTKGLPVYRDQAKKSLDVRDYKNIIYKDHNETPLLLATARGIIEVVKIIIKTDPQAVDYVTSQNRNILHLAILHRQKKIFKWLRAQKLVMDRLCKRIDVMGFTVLHQVGIVQYVPIHQHGPALQLQRELVWFDSVQKTIPPLYATHQNKVGWEAREFFDETHKEILDSAKEWLKNTSESCSAVAVLVATVVFAAAFSVPGGLNGKTGSPVLLTQPLYMVFTIVDIIGLTTSLCSVVFFLSILTSSFKMDDFQRALPLKLSLGFQLLFFSIVCTMMAFTLAIVLTVKSEEMKWAIFVAKEINLIFIGGLRVGFGRNHP